MTTDIFRREQLRQSSGPYCYCCNDYEWNNTVARRKLRLSPADYSVDSDGEYFENSDLSAYNEYVIAQQSLDVENEKNLKMC